MFFLKGKTCIGRGIWRRTLNHIFAFYTELAIRKLDLDFLWRIRFVRWCFVLCKGMKRDFLDSGVIKSTPQRRSYYSSYSPRISASGSSEKDNADLRMLPSQNSAHTGRSYWWKPARPDSVWKFDVYHLAMQLSKLSIPGQFHCLW